MSQVSSISKVIGHELGSQVSIPGKGGDFSLHHHVQVSLQTHLKDTKWS
jgi:hypothetical protein